MSDQLRLLSHPELVIGLAGPIGIDIEQWLTKWVGLLSKSATIIVPFVLPI